MRYNDTIAEDMRKFAILAIFIAIKVLGGPTDEELLSSERIAAHKDAFQIFETILADAGFRKADYEEVHDPTLHFAKFIEWACFIQPVFGNSKNELLIGFDRDGKLGMFGRESLAPMCECPGDHLYSVKKEKMDEAIKEIWRTQDSES